MQWLEKAKSLSVDNLSIYACALLRELNRFLVFGYEHCLQHQKRRISFKCRTPLAVNIRLKMFLFELLINAEIRTICAHLRVF